MTAIISSNPKVMHGATCFAGTRVTVSTLFDHLRTGYSVDEFLADFPSVTREQALGLLELARDECEHLAATAS